jgi:hypothetical protein
VSNKAFGIRRRNRDEPRPCFVVVSFEGCFLPGLCQAPHIFVDCEVHGTLARVHDEDAGGFIMRGHMDMPSWPKPIAPLNQECLDRILASKEGRNSTIFVPSTYKGGA